jgi:hypothetical protein
MPGPELRAKIGVLLFVLVCLLSNARYARRSAKVHSLVGGPSPSQYESRFDGLRAALPPHGVVGYLGDPRFEPASYFLAQYSLAPMLLDRSEEHPLVVGNFDASTPTEAIWPSDFTPLRDFGNGVILLQRKAR